MAFNAQLKEILKNKLRLLLEKVMITNGYIELDSVYSNNEEFSKEADKVLEKHLGKWGTSSIIYDVCSKYLPPSKPLEGLTGSFLVNATIGKEDLIEAILDYLESIPFEFMVYLELGISLSQHFQTIKITEDVCLMNFSGDEEFLIEKEEEDIVKSILNKKQKLKKDRVYLACKKKGFLINDLSNISTIQVISTIKKILYLGYATETFVENKRASVFGKRNRKDLIFRNLNYDPNEIDYLELTSDLGEFCFKLVLSPSLKVKPKNTLASLLGSVKEEDSETEYYSWERSYPEFFDLCGKLLSDTADPIKVDSIRRSIEWAFNAQYTQDINLSFIQGCMALEALLGDDLSSKRALHETLADRFAYLVGSNNANRRKNRENFLEIYEQRSQIVHGTSTHLRHDKIYLRNWLNKVLLYLIKKEIRSL